MIVPVSAIDIRFAPGRWQVPQALRDRVPAVWARLHAETPAMWDGRILGVSGESTGAPEVRNGILRGIAREDAYSAFLTWRELGFPEIGVRNLFGSAIVVSSDGAILLGEMAADTANAGIVYPPGGSLEPRDVTASGQVDVIGSIEQELAEETGLAAADARLGGTWAIYDGPRISVARFFHFPLDAAALRMRIAANLSQQAHRELSDMVIVRTPEDLRDRPTMPYVTELVAAFARAEVG